MEKQDQAWSLPHLQNLIKRDPAAYEGEFTTQLLHFDSTLDVFRMKPQKWTKHFNQQVMFMAHTAPCYPEKNLQFHKRIIAILEDHFRVLHPQTRKILVSALILLRNRGTFEILETLPLYFKLFTLNDKVMRSTLFTHIVRDILLANQKSKNQQWNREVQNFFFTQMKSQDLSVVRKAAAVAIALYKKRIWIDTRCVNMLSTLCLCKDSRVAAAAIKFLCGDTSQLEEEVQSDDEEAAETANKAAKESTEAKKNKRAPKSKKAERRFKRVKKSAKRLLERRSKKKLSYEASVNFAALDVLHDPQSLTERLLQRVMKQSDRFKFRLLALQLISRLVGRHELMVLNLYPYLLKYLTPHQRDVTQVLACLAMATHALVPPNEITPIVTHLINTFVNETCKPEVIVVGLNSIREICFRQPLILTEEQLADLSEFRKFKDKGVIIACRSLLNLFREVNPGLLHRSLRGKEAAMAHSRGDLEAPEYAENKEGKIDGLELFANKKLQPRRGSVGSASESELSDLSDMGNLEDVDSDGEEQEMDSDSEQELLDSDAEEDEEELDSDAEESDDEAASSNEDEGEKAAFEVRNDEDKKKRKKSKEAPSVKDDGDEDKRIKKKHKKSEESEDEEEGSVAKRVATIVGHVVGGNNDEAMERSEKASTESSPMEKKEEQENEEKKEGEEPSGGNKENPAGINKASEMAQSLATETVFGSKDFKKMRKLSLKQSLQWQLGKKRAREADLSSNSSSSEGEESDSDASGTVSEEEAQETAWDVVRPEDLTARKKKRKGKAARLESVLKGREGKTDFKRKERRGGSTNKEKNRNKPMLMTLRKSRGKTMEKATNKMRNLQKHIKQLKRKTNKRRRA